MDDMQVSNSLKVSDIISSRLYRSGYQEQVLGKAPQDQSLNSYMTEREAVKNSKMQSQAAYVKEGKITMTSGKLPVDCVEFERIQKNALNMSDAHYRQSRIKAIADFKAWQTMDYQTHPLVISSQLASLRNSDALYKKESQEILDSVYYPVFITEGYELAKKVSQATSNAIYRRAAKAIETEHKCDFTKSDYYKTCKDLKKVQGRNYTAHASELAEKVRPAAVKGRLNEKSSME